MQEMTSAFCESLSEGDEGRLEDSRNSQLYWVGKMKDGNCWMLQNLALGDIGSSTLLTPEDSNVTRDWTLPVSRAGVTDSGTGDNIIQSWNFGQWAYAIPLRITNCGDEFYRPISYCTRLGFVNVSSSDFQPTYTATTGNWEGASATNDTLVAVDCTTWTTTSDGKTCTSGAYDPHYLVGNFYSWNAATAGSGTNVNQGSVSESICPKGWKLPEDGSTNGTFTNLLNHYGISTNVTGTVDNVTYNTGDTPLYFVRSGFIHASERGNVVHTGNYVNYWSSTATSYSHEYARYLNIANASVGMTHANKWDGRSVRCVSQ